MSLWLCRTFPYFRTIYFMVRLRASKHYPPFQWPQGRWRELERERDGEMRGSTWGSLLDSTRVNACIVCVCVCLLLCFACERVQLTHRLVQRLDCNKAHHNTHDSFEISILYYSQLLTGGAVDLLSRLQHVNRGMVQCADLACYQRFLHYMLCDILCSEL